MKVFNVVITAAVLGAGLAKPVEFETNESSMQFPDLLGAELISPIEIETNEPSIELEKRTIDHSKHPIHSMLIQKKKALLESIYGNKHNDNNNSNYPSQPGGNSNSVTNNNSNSVTNNNSKTVTNNNANSVTNNNSNSVTNNNASNAYNNNY